MEKNEDVMLLRTTDLQKLSKSSAKYSLVLRKSTLDHYVSAVKDNVHLRIVFSSFFSCCFVAMRSYFLRNITQLTHELCCPK